MSHCLTNYFLFGQKKIISVSSTPSTSTTSYNPHIFYSIGAFFFKHFLQKNNFNTVEQFFAFLTFYLFVLVVILSIDQ